MSNWLHFEFCTNCINFFFVILQIELFCLALGCRIVQYKRNGNLLWEPQNSSRFYKENQFGAFSLNVESRKHTAGHSALYSSQFSLVMFIRTIQKLQQQCISCAVLNGNHKDKDAPYKTLPCTCVTTDIVYSNAPQRMHFSLFR